MNRLKENKKPKISMIAAIGRNREIGLNNQLLWRLPDDLKHFQKITTGHAVIMGQKTYESIGKPLPNRLNVVLSKDESLEIPECAVCNNVDDAVSIAGDYSDEIFIIGGGSVYAQFINKADKLYLTKIDAEFAADTFFPDYSKFKVVKKGHLRNYNKLNYRFTEWKK